MILIAIGSNLESDSFGSPYQNCLHAVESLKKNFDVNRISNFYKTEPLPKSSQPWFVNAVVCINTNLSPYEVLEILMIVEKSFKRIRNKKNEPRTIDLDLLAYNNEIINSENLILPHPRMHLRKFVMQPLCDLDENWKHPVIKQNANKILKSLAKQKILAIT